MNKKEKYVRISERAYAIATEACQQAYRYGIPISEKDSKQLLYFIHDWWRAIEDTQACIEDDIDSPNSEEESYVRMLESLHKKK